MPIEWDVLLFDVSIREEIFTFSIQQEKGGFTKQLTLFSVNPTFFDSFDYTVTPVLSVEVKTKLTDTWVSQGKFYIEKPSYYLAPSQKISRGVWGRSETAKAGEPFAEKVTGTWTENSTIQGIINEMAALVDLSVIFEIDDYPIYANTFSVDALYPIEIIYDLCTFAGAFVSCDESGNLIIKKEIFHPGTPDHTIDDTYIRELTESIVYPEFGNRIKVSAFGSNTGYTMEVKSLGEADCLPADGVSELVLLAFVSLDGVPVEDNILVSWESETGVTLEKVESPTQSYLISKQTHKASNYNTVVVEFPILDIVGIWAYSDVKKSKNYWDSTLTGCFFSGKEITVGYPFEYCDQTLIITYITTGVSVNTIVAGSSSINAVVSASLEGADAELEIALGNLCACGSSLDVRKVPDSQICIGNKGYVVTWAEIGNTAAVGMIANFSIDGCGELSSTKKTLGDVNILNEKTFVYNTISGVSQANTEIIVSALPLPEVYLITDTNKDDNLFSSFSGKVIDLNTILDNGTEVYIDYTGSGAAAVTWRTVGLDEEDDDCDAIITVKVADGSEEGLEESVTYTAQDCKTEDEEYDDATTNNYTSIHDPDDVDNDTDEGGDEDEDDEGNPSGAVLSECDVMMLNIWANVTDATPEDKDSVRFGVPSRLDCPEEGAEYPCGCPEICEREVVNRGNTFEYDETVHDQALVYGDEGSPDYNEAYSTIRAQNLAECETKCEDTREAGCDCVITGVDVLDPGESAEYFCSDGSSEIITMPEDACGTHTFTIGCCEIEIRSSDGHWAIESSGISTTTGNCGTGSAFSACYVNSQISGGTMTNMVVTTLCVHPDYVDLNDCERTSAPGAPGTLCSPVSCSEATGWEGVITKGTTIYSYTTFEWVC